MQRVGTSADLPADTLEQARRAPLPKPPLLVHDALMFGPESRESPSHAVISPAGRPQLTSPASPHSPEKGTVAPSTTFGDAEESASSFSLDGTVAAVDGASTLEEADHKQATLPEKKKLFPPLLHTSLPQKTSETFALDKGPGSICPSEQKQDGDDVLTMGDVSSQFPPMHASTRSQRRTANPFIPLDFANSEGKDQQWRNTSRWRTSVSAGSFSPAMESSGPFGRCESGSGVRWLSLTILGMSPLHADPSVVSPFVRVWFVNAETGETLIQNIDERASFSLTHPVNLCQRRTRAPWWGAELAFRVDASVLDDPSLNAMFLLEVLEAGSESIQGHPLRRGGLYPICWGFLRLHDKCGRLYLRECIDIQMFPFPHRTSCFTKFLQLLPSWFFPYGIQGTVIGSRYAPVVSVSQANTLDTPERVNRKSNIPPQLFYIYKNPRNRKVPYSAGMLLSLKKINDERYLSREAIILPYEESLLNQMCVVDAMRPKRSMTISLRTANMHRMKNVSDGSVNIGAFAKSYARDSFERVVPPTTILQQIRVKGSVTSVAFSNNGFTMAFAVSSGFEHIIQLRSTLEPEMPVEGVFHAHIAHIHHITFNRDDQLLLSCSSDKTAKVWRLKSCFVAPESFEYGLSGCLCTLSHEFPVYDGIFYKDHIVTCGYDTRLFVWRYHTSSNEALVELDSRGDFSPSARKSREEMLDSSVKTIPPGVSFGTESDLCELVHIASDNDRAIFSSLCASELNRIWSVDGLGNVVIWRAFGKKGNDGKRSWQMSVQHRFNCPGATRIEVCGTRALATCAKLSVCYLFDAIKCRLMQKIILHQRPYVPALTLLPDGEAIVAGTGDGKLLGWECSTGARCTSRDGYGKTQVGFAVDYLTWSGAQQLCALLGTKVSIGNPNSEARPRFTMIALLGTPRSEESIINCSDGRAADYFRARFGGELKARRSGRTVSWDSRASLGLYADKNLQPKNTEVPQHAILSEDRTTRMDQIVSMWKSLVGQHRQASREKSDGALCDSTAVYVADDV